VGASLFVIEERDEAVADFAPRGVKALAGTAQSVLPASNITKASALFVAIPESFEAGQIVEQARATNKKTCSSSHVPIRMPSPPISWTMEQAQ
jgi:CPA2 family monovalent cation:H+ antiporter-2